MVRTLALVVALAGAAVSAVSATAAPDVSHFTLANGLQVVVVPDHRAPVVTHMIWYKVGSADETPGKSGLAHFLEHLMFKGTEKNPGDAFSRDVAAIGGQENAFTGSDYTAFFQRVPRDRLKDMMRCHRRRSQSRRRGNLCQGAGPRRNQSAATAQGTGAGSGAHRHARRFSRRATDREPRLSRSLGDDCEIG